MSMCPECEGTGVIVLVGCADGVQYQEDIDCPLCQGSGEQTVVQPKLQFTAISPYVVRHLGQRNVPASPAS